MRRLSAFVILAVLVALVFTGCTPDNGQGATVPIGVAVEFNDHGACAYIAQDRGLFKEAGLNLAVYESYVTGTALAAALTKGDIQVAYICLAPAINAYANAGVPIKVITGTHKYGYGLVVNSEKIKRVQDLENMGTRIGCVQPGAAVDVLMHKIIDKYGLDQDKVVNNTQRMNPPKQILAIKAGKLDAAFLPEHWATMAEDYGLKMLLDAEDVWNEMQGSVLIVREDLIANHPQTVQKLVNVSQKASTWSNENPTEAAQTMARQLQSAAGGVFPAELTTTVKQLEITPEILFRSMERLKYTTDIDPVMVQATIDYMASLGYIKNTFQAESILDLQFLK